MEFYATLSGSCADRATLDGLFAAGKESVPPFTTATRTHHMSVAATRT